MLLVAAGLAVAGCGGGSKLAATRAQPVVAGDCIHAVPADLAAAGPFRVHSARAGLTRRASTSAEVRHIDPTAWFPERGAARCRFPLIVFSHGANGAPIHYAPLLRHLASEGFVVLAPLHPDRTAEGDESFERLDDIKYLLDHLRAVARRLAPRLAAEIDPRRIGIAGHSYGAFVASFEATDEPRIQAALTMAGPLRPGPADTTKVPVLAMAGAADTLVPARLVRAYYDQLPATVPHTYVEIAGADHSAYGRHCAAERTCGIVASYATSFFLTYLVGLGDAGRLLDPATPRPARVRLIGTPPGRARLGR